MKADRILVVCLGNICRSPMVAEVLRQRFAAAGREVLVESCGTGNWHVGQQADERMRKAAQAAGYDIAPHRARQLDAEDYRRFDLIVAMDADNLAQIHARRPADARADCGLFLALAGLGEGAEVPDPYYGSMADFRHVIDLAEAGADGLLAALSA